MVAASTLPLVDMEASKLITLETMGPTFPHNSFVTLCHLFHYRGHILRLRLSNTLVLPSKLTLSLGLSLPLPTLSCQFKGDCSSSDLMHAPNVRHNAAQKQMGPFKSGRGLCKCTSRHLLSLLTHSNHRLVMLLFIWNKPLNCDIMLCACHCIR